MTTQTTLDFDRRTFSAQVAEALTQDGIILAASSRESLIRSARAMAKYIAAKFGEVTADDVHQALIDMGLDNTMLGNGAGSLFTRGEFEFTGKWVPSTRVSNHGRYIRVWRLK